MEIKELDKKQLILLTLLITFVVSIATGIVTVSLMNQAPKSVPQTINNVIQKTIERVTTVETPVKPENINESDSNNNNSNNIIGSGEVMIPIYLFDENNTDISSEVKEIGQGVLISDSGLLLVESNILTDAPKYKIILNKIDFEATLLKKFDNGFTILKISEKSKNDIPQENDKTEVSETIPTNN